MSGGIQNLNPDTLRQAGQEFLGTLEKLNGFRTELAGLLAKAQAAGQVNGTTLPMVDQMVAALKAAVDKVDGEIDTIAGNVEKLGRAFVQQANATQDVDETTAKKTGEVDV